jgi:uncharacterized protein (TIGR00106 family)
MVLLEFSISPLDKGESLSPWVAKVIDVIRKSGVTYQLNAMGTILEGEYEEVMAVVAGCFKTLAAESSRISITIKIDYRTGDDSRLLSKTEKIKNILGPDLNITG